MKNKKLYLLLVAVLLSVLSLTSVLPIQTIEVFSKVTRKVGSAGSDVREMQGRLKYLGFYKGKIDGRFGWGSYWALRNFQYKFGMRVDGVLGPKTKLKLYNASKRWRPGAGTVSVQKATPKKVKHTARIASNDLRIMANAVYGEARGEPYIGQVAIAAVILNRAHHPSFPNTPAGVIFEPRAFTAVADGQIWLTPNAKAKKAVQDALKGWDPTGGAIYYFNPDTATSAWIWSRPQIKRIGNHIFCR